MLGKSKSTQMLASWAGEKGKEIKILSLIITISWQNFPVPNKISSSDETSKAEIIFDLFYVGYISIDASQQPFS